MECFEDLEVAISGLQVLVFLSVIDDEVAIVDDFEIGHLGFLDVLRLDFFGYDEEANEVFLLDHDLHLVKDEFKLFAFIHGPVCFNLHLLEDSCGLGHSVVVLLMLSEHQDAAGVFHLEEDLFFADLHHGVDHSQALFKIKSLHFRHRQLHELNLGLFRLAALFAKLHD